MTSTVEARGYLEAFKLFSRNARLYVLHVIGMDMIHGTWHVLFNLYLLAAGFDIKFVGSRLAIAGVAGALLSIPAGRISDRIGRKASFILGDGMGALLGLVNIMTMNRTVLLVTAATGALFSALHNVSEPPFMQENSTKAERIHLFSLSDSLRTTSAMVGSLLAGFLPLMLADVVGKVTAYRWATFVGLALWFLSLIPAFLLRSQPRAQDVSEPSVPQDRRRLLAGIERPGLMARLAVPDAAIAFGGGMVLPLSNVFFSESLHAHEGHIGTTFALGQGVIAVAALFAPLLIRRLSNVGAVAVGRLTSLPFVLVIAVVAAGGGAEFALPIVSVAWILRAGLANMSRPIESAFSMEILSLRERATLAGIDSAVWSGLTAAGAFIGSRLMSGGNYWLPFVVMAACYALSVGLFWLFFRRFEASVAIPALDPLPVEA